MSDVKLFTQSELTNLNQQLSVVQKNLNVHVNDDLSHAHAFSIYHLPYYDSGGDLVGDYIMVFQFGEPPNETTIYVPLRTFGGSLSLTDPGPRDVGDGISHSAISPTGTATSPGIPITQKALVTTSPAQVSLNNAFIYNQLLLLHSEGSVNDVRELQVHGGITFSSDSVYDALGHLVGRKTVNFGYNGVLYKAPGDTSISGPPQGPRITFQEPQTYFEGGSSEQPFQFGPPSPHLIVGFGAAPLSFQWQNYVHNTGAWVNFGSPVTPSVTTRSGILYVPANPYGWNPNTQLQWYARLFGGNNCYLGDLFAVDRLYMRAGKNVKWPFIVRCVVSNAYGSNTSKAWYIGSNGYNGDSGP